MFQLYWPNDPELRESLVRRAEAAGYEAIIVTVDNAFPGWKPRDLQNAYLPVIEGIGPRQLLLRPGLPRRRSSGRPRRTRAPRSAGSSASSATRA